MDKLDSHIGKSVHVWVVGEDSNLRTDGILRGVEQSGIIVEYVNAKVFHPWTYVVQVTLR